MKYYFYFSAQEQTRSTVYSSIYIIGNLSTLLACNHQSALIEYGDGWLAPLRRSTLPLGLLGLLGLLLALGIFPMRLFEVVAFPLGIECGSISPNGSGLIRCLVRSHGTGAMTLGLSVTTEHAKGDKAIAFFQL